MSATGTTTGIALFPKAPPPAAAPTVTAADNGLSLSGTTVQLGQTIGAVGNPANFLHDTEIPLDGFLLSVQDLGSRKLLLDPINDVYKMGDVDALLQDGVRLILDNIGATGEISAGVGGATERGSMFVGASPGYASSEFSGADGIGGQYDLFLDTTNRAYLALNSAIIFDMNRGTGFFKMGELTNTFFQVNNNTGQFEFTNTALNSSIKINGVNGFTGTITPVNTITVNGGIVTNVA